MATVRVMRKNKDGLLCQQYVDHTELSKRELRESVVELQNTVYRDTDEILFLRKLLLQKQGEKNDR